MHFAISDLHLSPEHPELLAGFQRLCMRLPEATKSLWILGDLFDFWIGDDAPNPVAEGVIKALRPLHARGVSLHFVPGNRDFLVGQQFAELANIQIHHDGKMLVINGRPTWLIHGDHLCIDDRAYMQFRQIVRNRSWQQDFLGKTVEERLAMAQQARQQSSTENATKPEDIMDVNEEYTVQQVATHGALDLIHGHTHRPAFHPLGEDGTRYVLGDWRNGEAVICQWDNNSAPVLKRLNYAADDASLGTPL
ncbi:UDP-2,3-diacylglucosamine diphosphatase [Natronospirillum operosum]|uniref:UDP-2,3-diacylglucosamine hydrolase n=1 Tax=Natronospirillum operosum TaxID=2759953 RepID=A0A4Z0WIE8_9GAMM|nr:UDP-2,3-diacylglucosamine diphosphatase [Natronospirillum operosum]TGG95566.1 UDP-2,3-diacylglucosamine diphosphatase [Natronospirillum operosum]